VRGGEWANDSKSHISWVNIHGYPRAPIWGRQGRDMSPLKNVGKLFTIIRIYLFR